ncbi:MAG: ATP synthase F1 subunit epsilon [Rickettsiales bacterium]|nr:MAG: ATP synthase F1 subunit epsilon [Rickettsiales bacterium]
MENFSVKIILPSKTALSTDATMVSIPGKDGDFTVLKGHVRLISNIKIGIVSIFANDKQIKYFVYGGIAQVNQNELNILSDFAVNIDDFSKTIVLDNIASLQNKLSEIIDKDSLEAQITFDKLEKYQALLKFL